jgi:hypothetical protein
VTIESPALLASILAGPHGGAVEFTLEGVELGVPFDGGVRNSRPPTA